MSKASVAFGSGAPQRVVKGAPAAVMALTPPASDGAQVLTALEAQGYRVLAVAIGPEVTLKLAGFSALSDPPRADSAALVTELQTLGVRTVMATGDAALTAVTVAHAVGLTGDI